MSGGVEFVSGGIEFTSGGVAFACPLDRMSQRPPSEVRAAVCALLQLHLAPHAHHEPGRACRLRADQRNGATCLLSSD
eukprot:1187306-Prorocentrum_minimum.AAC.1